ncbi:oxidoreductase molybdopterin binding domain protein [Collimonas fungivorans]|uniref:Oxidoreductase molybdopterin binding domain protein n=1 Tax=Collimonas fungivorans TaxID=158899 RepID=A0A127P5G7_9BURK|nr:molybdopterin-dependent oxidoreductase [Collimonas fungivorans]AMO92967.1 oxidoreductase molybdopterin binding domain protein [Collimonas fungivorans]
MSDKKKDVPKNSELQPELVQLQRRLFLRSGLSLGALSLLSGCNLQDGDQVDKVLWAMSRWNDRVQSMLFRPSHLAPTYPASMITKPFPFNAFYDADSAPEIDGDTYKLEVSGLVRDKRSWNLAQLRALPQASQITRHICIEGWSAIGQWSGVPFRTFLAHIGADTTAKYVGFKCADRYYSSIDMATALHPQTILALDFGQEPLPTEYGYPLKLRVPTKLGFKNPKHIAAIFVTNENPGGYWEDQGYNWFSGS